MILHHGRTTGFAFVALVATALLAVYTANAYPTPRALQDVAVRAAAQPDSVMLEVVATREPKMNLALLTNEELKARDPCTNCECEADCPAMCCPQKTAAAAERSISDNIVADTLALTMATPPLELRGQNCIECGEGEDRPQAGPPNCCPVNHTHGHALVLDNHQATVLLAEAGHQNVDFTLMARDLDVNDVEQHHKRQTLDELALLPNKKLRDNGDPCESCTCPHCPSMCCGSTTVVAEERALDGDADFAAPRLLDDTPQRVRLATSKELASRDEGPAETLQSKDYCDLCECELDCPNECCVGQMPLTARIAGEATTRKGLEGDVLPSTELTIRGQKATEDIKTRGYCDECDCAVDCPQECCEDQTTLTARIAGEAPERTKEVLGRALPSNELAVRDGEAAQDIKARSGCEGCDCNFGCPLECCPEQADLTARIAGAEGEVVKDDDAGTALLWRELSTREQEAKDIDIRDNCDGCSCDGDCPATCCEGETTATARIAGKVVIDTVENLERHLVSTELANRGEQATEEIKARQNCEGCLGLDSSLACPGWCPPACCPGQATTERRIAGEVEDHAAKRDLQGHALLATELAIPRDDQEKTAEISARACIHCSCDAGDCPEYCCEPQTTTTARFAGKMVAGPQEDPEGDLTLSIELAIPGGQEKDAELKIRNLWKRYCENCDCEVDCPLECCGSEMISRAGIADEAMTDGAAGVEKSLAGSNTLATTELAAVETVEARINPCSLCYCHSDCPAECCAEETTVTERIAGNVMEHAEKDFKGHTLVSSELAIPGDQDKTAEPKARDICLGCTCDADCPEICCEGQTVAAARDAEFAVDTVKGAVAGLEDRHLLTWTELAVPRDEDEAAEIKIRDYCEGCTCDGDCPAACCQGQTTVAERIAGEVVAPAAVAARKDLEDRHSPVTIELAIPRNVEKSSGLDARDLWRRYCENCDCEVDCPLECCGSETLATERIAGKSATGDLEGRSTLPWTELTVRDGQVAETIKKSNYCDECSCDVDCPAECCPPEQTIVVGRLAGEVEAPPLAVRGDDDVNDGLAVSSAFAVRGEETVDIRACGGCFCGHTNCPTWCCGEEAIAAAGIADVARTVEGRVQDLEERHHLLASTELTARGQETVKPDSCGGCDCDEGDCPVVCCGEATTVTARIAEPAAEGAEDHHPRASAELTVRGTGLVKPDNCPSCVCGEADCPTECCGTQEIVAERIAAESADLEGRAFSESTGVAVRGEKKAVEIKGGAALDDCAGCTCGETGCPTECCGEQTIVMGRLAGELIEPHEAAEEVLVDRHHHTPAATELELVVREDETMQTRDCTNCICDEQECPAVCCPAKVSTTDGNLDVVKVLPSVEGRGEQEG